MLLNLAGSWKRLRKRQKATTGSPERAPIRGRSRARNRSEAGEPPQAEESGRGTRRIDDMMEQIGRDLLAAPRGWRFFRVQRRRQTITHAPGAREEQAGAR